MNTFKEEPDLERLAEAALGLAPEHYVPLSLVGTDGVHRAPLDVQSTSQRFVVVGGAGAGKTVLARHLVSQAARGFLRDKVNEVCPIYIRGIELSRIIADPNYETLAHGRVLLTRSELVSLLSLGKASLWLDGLDELPREAIEDPVLWQMLSGEWKVVISTRPPVHQALAEWQLFELAALDLEQARVFVSKLSPNTDLAEKFIDLISKQQGLLDLVRSPLLLEMLFQVFLVSGSLPDNPTSLFSMTIQTYLERWDSKRSSINILTRSERVHFLSHIARRMYGENRYALYRSEIILVIRDQSTVNFRPEEVLEDITTTGLLRRERDGQFEFAHKSLMMYLIAYGLQDDPADLAILLRENDSAWRELVQLFGALAQKVDDLVEAFLEFGWVTQAAYALSAGSVRNDDLESRVADTVEAQLGSKFIRSAARYWVSKSDEDPIEDLRLRKEEELALFNRATDPTLSAHERGKLFEQFVAAFFGGPFRLINGNVLTLHGEFDLVFELVSKGPFWHDLGGQVLVECKNEAKRANTEQVNHFMQKVNNVQDIRVAFFVARSGVGRAALDAMRVQAANPAKPLVIPISGEQVISELDNNLDREDFFVHIISDAKLMRR